MAQNGRSDIYEQHCVFNQWRVLLKALYERGEFEMHFLLRERNWKLEALSTNYIISWAYRSINSVFYDFIRFSATI